jgi:alpha-L-fucosidase
VRSFQSSTKALFAGFLAPSFLASTGFAAGAAGSERGTSNTGSNPTKKTNPMKHRLLPLILLLCSPVVLWAEEATDTPPVDAAQSDGTPPKYGRDSPESGIPIKIPERDPRTLWFETAKLGIFLHWGIWAVDATPVSNSINHPGIPGRIDAKRYFSQLPRWQVTNFDPAKWAEVFKKAGAKYTIITTKHHDGVALWDTKAPGGIDVVDDGGVKRDLLKPWVAGMREAGLRIGFYFSNADWSHPDYDSMTPPPNQAAENRNAKTFPLSYAEKDDPEKFARFLKFRDQQIEELMVYKPDIWWFDGDWERTAEQWNTKGLVDRLIKNDAEVIFGRIGAKFPGVAYVTTPETVMPLTTPERPWELCLTFSDSWAYVRTDKQDKSAPLLVKIFSEMIGRGGNLLLNIGPKADGTLPENQVRIILEFGEWVHRNAEAIYPTFGGEQFGLSFPRFYGSSTVAPDGKALYLFVDGQPTESIILRGVVSKIRKAEVLTSGEELNFRRLPGNGSMPGYYVIKAPKSPDPLMTVVKLSFDEVIQLSKK